MAVPRGATPARAARPVLSFRLYDERMLLLVLACYAIAVWPSISTLLPLAGGDTPLSFVPLIPFVGIALLIWRFDAEKLRSAQRDAFLDAIVLGILVVITTVVLAILPIVMSWDFWLDRLDIPGAVLLLTVLLVATWGIPALTRLWPALLYLLLAWPLPFLLLDQHVLPDITDLTAAAARTIAPLLHLGIRPDVHDSLRLLVPYHGKTTHLLIEQACSGVNGSLGLVALGIPVAILARGRLEPKLLWLGFGVLLSWSVNVIRILIIAAVAAIWGPGPTFSIVHPVFGLALFALSFLLLLVVTPVFRLDLSTIYGAMRQRPTEAPTWRYPQIGLLAAVLLVGGVLENNLSQFSWITNDSLPSVSLKHSSDLVHAPSGWRITTSGNIAAWRSLFGSSTVSSVMVLRGPDGRQVRVQAIMSKDASAFNTYGVEDCYTFHGFTMHSVQRQPLGNGVTGSLIDFVANGQPMASVYWLQPVRTPRGQFHERIVLVADARSGPLPENLPTAPLSSNPIQVAGSMLAGLFSPWIGGHAGPEYTNVNAELRLLGQQIIERERTA